MEVFYSPLTNSGGNLCILLSCFIMKFIRPNILQHALNCKIYMFESCTCYFCTVTVSHFKIHSRYISLSFKDLSNVTGDDK